MIISGRSEHRLYRFLGCTLLLLSTGASALVHDITATFNPDSANPMKNEFLNTTRVTGVCAEDARDQCERLGIFSIRAAFRADTNRSILANHVDPRQGAMWQVPSGWRDVPVIHTTTGERATVQVRIAGIGVAWFVDRSTGVSVWGRPGINWADLWRYAPSPCESIGYFNSGINFARFFWLVPEGAGACSRQPGGDIPRMWYHTLDYAYAIKTPNPLTMSSGEYTGHIDYAMGPGADFDFGDVMVTTDPNFRFNFNLKVEHTLKVDIPPGGNRVELVPQGGWQSWLQQTRKPTRLFRDQTFNISASSRFKMLLECQSSPDGKTCWMQDPVSGHEVPLNISVSLPFGLNDANEQPVNRRPLLLDGSGTEKFQPGIYVERKPGTLHFEIPQSEVAGMIGTGAQRKYSGNVTVIWDSEV